MGSWGLAVAALIGALAWLYQRAWDRHERRLSQYSEIVEGLPAFTIQARDPDKVDEILLGMRGLWLFGPDDVIRACNAFLSVVETTSPDEAKEKALAELVLAMRKDASFISAVLPRFFWSRLSADEIRVKSATRDRRA